MMENCNIIKDLLPLYAEGIAGEDTAALVEEHLKTCESCKAAYEALKGNAPEEETSEGRLDEAKPFNEIRKKLRRRRIIACIIAVVAALAAIVLFLFLKPADQRTGDSALFTEDEQMRAMECVVEDFRTLQGCKLFSLSYAGDEATLQEQSYQTETYPDAPYDEYMVIHSAFLSPLFGGGAWEGASLYTWNWILGRADGGEWVVLSKGYC